MDEREKVADELRRVRESVRDRALHDSPRTLPPHPAVQVPGPMPEDPAAEPAAATARPDNTYLNAGWRVSAALEGGGLWHRLTRRALGFVVRMVGAQEAFNARQVQFDNEVLAYVDARLDATHRHYDRILGIHGRHMGEIDERHLILQEELVAHVHDLVRRIDLVLSESERGRIGLELALRDLRARLVRLEERLEAR